MKQWAGVWFLLCVLVAACGKDPAKNVKIVDRPLPTSMPPATLPPGWEWHDENCKLPVETAGSSDLSVTGTCTYHQKGDVHCTAELDDFLMMIKRHAPKEATLTLFINVEKWTAPGDYTDAQMFLALNNGKTGYRWSAGDVKVTVGPDQKYLDFHDVTLRGEPPTPGDETLNGRLWCAPKDTTEKAAP